MAETPATEAERRRRAQVWLEQCLPDLDRRARARLARHDAEAFAARVDFVLVDLYHAIDVVYGLTHPTDELVERFVNMALDAAVRCPDDLRALDHRREVDQGWFQRALADAQYGMGGLIAVAVWSELGDCRRFSRSEQAVRHTGLDVSVDASDRRRAGGFLSRQGPQTLRWALYEAAKNSSHLRSPDHDFYAAVKARHDGKIAAISVARKLARRCYHVLRDVDPTRSTPSRPEHHRRPRRSGPPTSTSGSPAVSSCNRRARQHPCWTAFKH